MRCLGFFSETSVLTLSLRVSQSSLWRRLIFIACIHNFILPLIILYAFNLSLHYWSTELFMVELISDLIFNHIYIYPTLLSTCMTQPVLNWQWNSHFGTPQQTFSCDITLWHIIAVFFF